MMSRLYLLGNSSAHGQILLSILTTLGVSLICFYGIIWEIFLAELHGWLTVDERAFARLYPWNHEVSKILGRRRESEVIYRKKLHVPRLFYKIALRVFVAGKSSIALSSFRSARGQEHESIEFLCEMGWFFSLE